MARVVIFLLTLLTATSAFAQLASPNKAGVSMGHLHYVVKDIEANKRFWVALGGTAIDRSGDVLVRFPDVFVTLTKGESTGGTEGSVVNHVAFRVQQFATVEAAGLKVTRLANFPGVGSTMTPEGERIELFENSATNLTFTQDAGYQDAVAERHNRKLEIPIAFHHIHLYLPAGKVAEAKAWYAKVFGGVPGKRSNYDAVDLPGVNFNFSEAPKPTVPLKGRMLSHIGLEVENLEAFCKRLEGLGVTFERPCSKNAPDGAVFTDPWGTSISLSEGLRAVALQSSGQSAPRTPWGDPDLQGTYTNTYENGTPLEKPDEFAGRTLDQVKGEELANIRRAIQKRTIGAFLGPEHAPDNWWQDNLYLDRGSQAWLVIDPPDGKIPQLTPEAQKKAQARAAARKASTRGPADSYEDRSLYDRCITRGLPGSMMPAIYGNQYQIVQAPGYVAILYEMIHETRVIPLDDRATIGKGITQDMGDARGRWERDTLVVTTKNFKERSAYRNANADTLTLTERFQRIAPDKVRWTVTVDDPATWTKPWTFSLPLTADANPMPHYECHEGNYGLKNILSAARAEEKQK
jgi:catechol 2,3-dioxygenase-like lactoylglutathione lyase family enzyme